MTQSHHGGPEYHSTTTLNAIRKASPCEKGWLKLLKHLGKTKADDEPLDLLTVRGRTLDGIQRRADTLAASKDPEGWQGITGQTIDMETLK